MHMQDHSEGSCLCPEEGSEVPGEASQVGKHVGIQIVGEAYLGGLRGVFAGYSGSKSSLQEFGSHGTYEIRWVLATSEMRL